jgi:hypothetical protein
MGVISQSPKYMLLLLPSSVILLPLLPFIPIILVKDTKREA